MAEGAPFFLPEDNGQSQKDAAAIIAEVTASQANPVIPLPTQHYHTAAFVSSEAARCWVIGVNRQFGLALRHGGAHRDENAVAVAKRHSVQVERVAFHSSGKRQMETHAHDLSAPQLQVELQRFQLLSLMDPLLAEPIAKLAGPVKALYEAKLASGPQPDLDVNKIPVAPRTQRVKSIESSTVLLPPPILDHWTKLANQEPMAWTLLVQPVPRQSTRQLPGWKEVHQWQPWLVRPDSMPAIAYNETHIVALYQTGGGQDHDLQLVLDCGQLSQHFHNKKWSLKRQWIRPHPPTTRLGMCTIRLSAAGTLVWAMGTTIWLMPNMDQPDAPVRVFQLGADAKTIISSLWLDDVTETLTFATSHGECQSVNWRTVNEESFDVLYTPLEEPIFDVQRDGTPGGGYRALTINSVCGRLTAGVGHYTALQMERPVAFAHAGDRLYVLTKYGKLDVFCPGRTEAPLRGLLKIQRQPPLVYQTSWTGVWAHGDEVAALMADGTVHWFSFSETPFETK